MEGWSGCRMKWVTEIVDGICPECVQKTILVSVDQFYRCTRCGSDLEQKINGRISYMPANLSKEDYKMVLRKDGEEV